MIYELDHDEYYIADGGYFDRGQFAVTPTGHHNYSDRQLATVRARHETINGRLKTFKCPGERYRHDLEKHVQFLRAAVAIVQTEIENGGGTFQVEFNENDFTDFNLGES